MVKSTDSNAKKRVKHLSLLITMVLLIFVSSMLIFSHLIKEVNNHFSHIDTFFDEDIYENVIQLKDHIESDLYSNLKIVANSIEDDIMCETDLDNLENKLNSSKDIPEELETIFRNNIFDKYLLGIENDRNNIFICNKNGILSDYDITSATDSKTRTWEHEINNQYNKKLAKNTIDKILVMDDYGNLVFERKNDCNKKHELYDNVTNENIKKIIINEGLDGLKSYTFLLPVYITNDGDIFGKYDVVGTHKQSNNKIILIQEYSLYDYIMKMDIEEEINEVARQTYISSIQDQIMSHLYIFAISVIISVVCIIVIISIITNNISDLDEIINHKEE